MTRDRQDRERARGHQLGPERLVLEAELGEAELDRVDVGIAEAEDDQRPEEVVPHALEGEDRDRRQRRRCERQHHLPVRLEVAGVVELGGLLEVPRDGEEELTHQEELRRQHEVDRDEAEEAADESPVRQHLEDRHEAELVGDHQRREHEHEQDFPAGEAEARERIAAEGGQDEVRRA